METTFDSRIIKVEHRMIFERISNTSGQCVFRTTTLDRSPSNNPRSLRESISRFRDTRLPTTASPLLLPLINRHDWNSRYLSSNNWTNFHFSNSGPDNTTWNWRSREIFTRYCCFTDDDFKSRSTRKFITSLPHHIFDELHHYISPRWYTHNFGEGISGRKFRHAGRVNPFGWKWTFPRNPCFQPASGMVPKAVHGRRIPSCRTIPKEV